MLKQLSKAAKGDQLRLLSQRRRWIRGVGKKAPDVLIRTEDLTEFSTTGRGNKVLLIDFWNVLLPPDEQQVKALRDLYEEYRYSVHVEFVGVNADAEARVDEAKQFAQNNGYVWKQRYECQAREAPITHQAFHAGNPPWQVLVDTFGYVRAIGVASEPGFQYALRAATAEAHGDYEMVMPRDRDGTQPTPPSVTVEPKAKKFSRRQGELPSNPEARSKLNLARIYLKTGKRTDAKRLFEEIVRDYPGTQEAKEAQEYLDVINP
jgi:tetratricopeptide (TPR) repeat protein